MKFLLTINALAIFAFSSLNAQNVAVDPAVEFPSKFEIGVDVGGALILPLASLANPNANFNIKPQAIFVYNASDLFFLDMAVGLDFRSFNDLSNNFVNYKMQGFFAKPSANLATSNRSFYAGLGFVFSNQNEKGVLRIKGEDFDDYRQAFEHNVSFVSLFFKAGTKGRITDRMNFGFELNITGGGTNITNIKGPPEIQLIEHSAGNGTNLSNDRSIFAITALAYLTFEI